MAAKFDFTGDAKAIQREATYSRVFTVTIGGALANFAGYTAKMHVRTEISNEDTVIELTTENNRITLGGSAGTITVSLTNLETTELSPGSYVYDLFLISGSGESTRYYYGKFEVKESITRWL